MRKLKSKEVKLTQDCPVGSQLSCFILSSSQHSLIPSLHKHLWHPDLLLSWSSHSTFRTYMSNAVKFTMNEEEKRVEVERDELIISAHLPKCRQTSHLHFFLPYDYVQAGALFFSLNFKFFFFWGGDIRQEDMGETEDEMVGWHHRLNGHEFEQALGGTEGQERLACCSPWS